MDYRWYLERSFQPLHIALDLANILFPYQVLSWHRDYQNVLQDIPFQMILFLALT